MIMKILRLSLKKEWFNMIESGEKKEEYREIKDYWRVRLFRTGTPTHVRFSYGYTKRCMLFEIKQIHMGYGKKKWGAPDCEVYIITLGNRIN